MDNTHSNKENGPHRVEENTLHQTLGLAEGDLRPPLGDLVDEHGSVLAVGHNRCEVVASSVPSHLQHEKTVCSQIVRTVWQGSNKT